MKASLDSRVYNILLSKASKASNGIGGMPSLLAQFIDELLQHAIGKGVNADLTYGQLGARQIGAKIAEAEQNGF
jgi:hypothetical protein